MVQVKTSLTELSSPNSCNCVENKVMGQLFTSSVTTQTENRVETYQKMVAVCTHHQFMKSSSTMELRQKLLPSGVNTSTYERTMQLARKVGNKIKINQLFLMREQYCLLVTAHGSL